MRSVLCVLRVLCVLALVWLAVGVLLVVGRWPVLASSHSERALPALCPHMEWDPRPEHACLSGGGVQGPVSRGVDLADYRTRPSDQSTLVSRGVGPCASGLAGTTEACTTGGGDARAAPWGTLQSCCPGFGHGCSAADLAALRVQAVSPRPACWTRAWLGTGDAHHDYQPEPVQAAWSRLSFSLSFSSSNLPDHAALAVRQGNHTLPALPSLSHLGNTSRGGTAVHGSLTTRGTLLPVSLTEATGTSGDVRSVLSILSSNLPVSPILGYRQDNFTSWTSLLSRRAGWGGAAPMLSEARHLSLSHSITQAAGTSSVVESGIHPLSLSWFNLTTPTYKVQEQEKTRNLGSLSLPSFSAAARQLLMGFLDNVSALWAVVWLRCLLVLHLLSAAACAPLRVLLSLMPVSQHFSLFVNSNFLVELNPVVALLVTSAMLTLAVLCSAVPQPGGQAGSNNPIGAVCNRTAARTCDCAAANIGNDPTLTALRPRGTTVRESALNCCTHESRSRSGVVYVCGMLVMGIAIMVMGMPQCGRWLAALVTACSSGLPHLNLFLPVYTFLHVQTTRLTILMLHAVFAYRLTLVCAFIVSVNIFFFTASRVETCDESHNSAVHVVQSSEPTSCSVVSHSARNRSHRRRRKSNAALLRKLCANLPALNPKPRSNQARVMMVSDRFRDKYPTIPNNISGMALREALLKFRAFCLSVYTEKPCHEMKFISQLAISVGHESAIHTLIHEPAMTDELNYQSPIVYFRQMAIDNYEAFENRLDAQRVFADAFTTSAQLDNFRHMVAAAYPPFSPEPHIESAIQTWQRRAEDLSQPARIVDRARLELAKLNSQLEQQRTEHESRTFQQQYDWLVHNDQPSLAAAGAKLQQYVDSRSRRRSDRNRAIDRYDQNDLQFHALEDMQALAGLCEFIVQYHSPITQVHVQMWRTRVMSYQQTPKNAFACLEAEALTLQRATHVHFDLHKELMDMVGRGNRGDGLGSFWPPTLWNILSQTMNTIMATQPRLRTDIQARIKMWVDTADSLYTDMIQQQPDVKRQIDSELQRRGEWKNWN
jgi:hypothetical protein